MQDPRGRAVSKNNSLPDVFLLTTNRKLKASRATSAPALGDGFYIPSASEIRSLQLGSRAQSLGTGISPLATAGPGPSSQASTAYHDPGWALTS